MAEGINGHKDDGENLHSSGVSSRNVAASSNATSNSNLDNNGSVQEDSKMCRDFLRKVCHRGNRCKYLHPQDSDLHQSQQQAQPTKRDIIFCYDFQNGYCPRESCRFVHCSVGEEEYYLRTGHILPHILEQATIKGQILDSSNGEAAPVCKDFLMGDCLRKRGGKCRFRHLSKVEYEQEICGIYNKGNEEPPSHDHPLGPVENGVGSSGPPLPDHKRQRFEPPMSEFPRESWNDREFVRPMDDMGRMEIHPREMSLREYRDRDRELDRERDRRGLEEILLLRKQLETLKKEIASLKKENSDLRATNDFLLEKVTTLGMNKAGGTVTTVTVPAVSLASTIPVATSVRPLTAAQVSHPLSITSECSVGSVVAMPPPHPPGAPPQAAAPTQAVGVAPPPTAVLGSVGQVQVSLSQAPALTAVTLSTVNLNPSIAPATSMAPTIAPSIAPPSPISAPLNLAPAMSISGASAGHLVSYPIMTQPGLRPQMQ